MKVIGFTGLPGSGKSTAIDAIRDLGKVITMGDVIRNEAKIRGIDPTGENLGKIAKELRNKWGQEIIAIKCVELIRNFKDDIIFIDGVRSIIEVNEFRKFWKFPLIATILDEKSRFERLLRRGRPDDPKTIEEMRERDQREIKFGTKEVISNVDYTLDTAISIEETKQKARELVKKVIDNY